MSARRRIALLDEIRGFCILCMVFYHAFYLFGSQLHINACTRLFHFFEPAQIVFASAFIFISGICTQFSRSVLKRGLLLLGIALAISGATILLLPRIGFETFQDRFGILHLLSACMLLYALLRKPLDRMPPLYGAIACIVLYAASSIAVRHIRVDVPYLFPLGFCSDTFYSADYFPILPNVFVFLLGTIAGRQIADRDLPDPICRTHVHLYAFCGRYSLWIYLTHIPVLLILIKIIERF